MELYLAGGCVRDFLLGKTPLDIDVVFQGTAEEFVQRYPKARKVGQGEKSIFIVNSREFAPMEHNCPLADIARRDFTINALLVAENGRMHYHPRTVQDLEQKILHPASSTALKDDPLRFFRAARLLASLPAFKLSEECLGQMQGLTPEDFLSIAPERVGQELLKACAALQPGNFLRTLAHTVSPWLPELENANSIPAGPASYHKHSVLGHTARIMDATADFAHANGYTNPKDKTRTLAVWMALCHDLGKVSTDPTLLPKHYGHEHRGIEAAEALGQRLRLPSLYIEAGKIASNLHMIAGQYHSQRTGTIVRLLTRLVKKNMLIPFFLMVCNDAGDHSLLESALRDAACIQQVSLPAEWHNKGEKSAERLHELRCQALAAAR